MAVISKLNWWLRKILCLVTISFMGETGFVWCKPSDIESCIKCVKILFFLTMRNN